MLKSVPVSAIRSRAYKDYPYSVTVDTSIFNDAVNRMKLFVGAEKSLISYVKITFNSNSLILSDTDNKNTEIINYTSINKVIDSSYSLVIDLNDLQAVLDTYFDSNITFNFGDNQALIISRVSIKNIIPEVLMND